MNDDFNTRTAMVEVQSIVRELQSLFVDNNDDDFIAASVGWLTEFAGGILGLLPDDETTRSMVSEDNTARSELEMIVEPLLVERSLARDSKNWARADEIRNELSALGVIVKDGLDGPVWELK